MSLESRSFAPKIVSMMLAGMLPLAAHGQSARPESVGLSQARLQRISEMVDRNIKAGEITGAVTLVARNGRVVSVQAQGVSDLEKKTPMRTDTLFRIASMTKPVVGVSILILVEEGKVRLTDPISRFLPQFKTLQVNTSRPATPALAQPVPGAAPPPPQSVLVPTEREVTLLDLLTHTSGVVSGPVSTEAAQGLLNSRQKTGLKWTESLHTVPLEFQPGSRWSYSPVAGFDLLAHIVEIASGQNFNEFTSQRIFKPLGMRDTFYWPSTDALRARLVGNYTKTAEGLKPRPNPNDLSGETYYSGGGGLMSTAESYSRFAMMLANGGELNGVRILSPRSVELMGSAFIPDTLPGRPAGEGYGLGVRVVVDPVKRLTPLSRGAFGWSGAFGTHFFVDPSKKLIAIMMIQTPAYEMRGDFEAMVMQAVVE